jgi:DNA polymerase III subunit chi
MTEANIYQLSKSLWVKSFPKLLEGIINKGNKVLVYCDSEEYMAKLDDLLWTFEQLAFLPHATAKDDQKEAQPILLNTTDANLNNANVLAIAGKSLPKDLAQFEKIVLMYEGSDLLSEDFIRNTINVFQSKSISYTVFKQNATGAWEKGNI